MGLVKNRYIGCTFITPDQRSREQAVRIKLGALRSCVEGRRVVMIDDSIVRGTTSRQIVVLLREAGAVQVHLRISAPPFIAPCYFGTDIPDSEHLIAHDRSPEEICALTGADSLGSAAEGPASDRPGRWLRLLRRMLHWQLSHPPLREIGDARRKFFLTMGAAATIISHNSKGAVAWTTAPLSVFSGNTVKRNEGEEYCGDSVPASGGW